MTDDLQYIKELESTVEKWQETCLGMGKKIDSLNVEVDWLRTRINSMPEIPLQFESKEHFDMWEDWKQYTFDKEGNLKNVK